LGSYWKLRVVTFVRPRTAAKKTHLQTTAVRIIEEIISVQIDPVKQFTLLNLKTDTKDTARDILQIKIS
jgi:hypothetical protein